MRIRFAEVLSLHRSQPQGVSFDVGADGETISWQKWRFRCCFDVREGMVLRNVTYDGRPVFYRMALSEMMVPYGASGRQPGFPTAMQGRSC